MRKDSQRKGPGGSAKQRSGLGISEPGKEQRQSDLVGERPMLRMKEKLGVTMYIYLSHTVGGCQGDMLGGGRREETRLGLTVLPLGVRYRTVHKEGRGANAECDILYSTVLCMKANRPSHRAPLWRADKSPRARAVPASLLLAMARGPESDRPEAWLAVHTAPPRTSFDQPGGNVAVTSPGIGPPPLISRRRRIGWADGM